MEILLDSTADTFFFPKEGIVSLVADYLLGNPDMETAPFPCKCRVPTGDARENGKVEHIDVRHLRRLWLPYPPLPRARLPQEVEKFLFNVGTSAIAGPNGLVSFVLPSGCNQFCDDGENIVFEDPLKAEFWIL